jgi:hypothetical protein
MAVYVTQGAQASTSTGYKSAIYIVAGSTARRGMVFDMNLGAQSAPAASDTNLQFDLSRQTALASSSFTAYTPVLANPADAAFAGTAGVNNASTEPTITSNSSVFNIAMNQRAPFRWQTYLGSGAELVYPATQSNGFALRVLSAGYTGGAGGTIYHVE